jgi:hypothetical protein
LKKETVIIGDVKFEVLAAVNEDDGFLDSNFRPVTFALLVGLVVIRLEVLVIEIA